MKNEILDLIKKLHVAYRWVDHPAVFTVAESVQHIEDKKPIKNLLLQEKGSDRKFLVIMSGDKRLDTKQLAAQLGTKKLHFANEEVLLQTLGVTPGAVSVFGLLFKGSTGVMVVIEDQLLKADELGFHPNDNTATIFMPADSLEKIIQSTGHSYKAMKL